MLNSSSIVGVCSSSFSNNNQLRLELEKFYKNIKYNFTGTRLKGKKLIKFLSDVDIAIIALEKIDLSLIKKLPRLKKISKFGVGLNNIDLPSLKKNGIKLISQEGTNSRSVAELCLAMSLISLRSLPIHISNTRNLKWKNTIGSNLTNKTFGIIGCGNVGKELVKLLNPFKCNILVYDKKNYFRFNKTHSIKRVNLKTIFKKCDIISLNIPLDKSTENLINYNLLNLLKSDSILINTSRGGIVKESDLFALLKKNKSIKANFDVLKNEPNINKNLISLDNFILTPHIGGSTHESIYNMGISSIRGLLK